MPGTLIVSEATIISHSATGALNVPAIWSENHVKSWRKVTDAVHAKGCFIYCQLWHQGRASYPDALKSEGLRMLSASAVPIGEGYQTPEAMTDCEIQEAIADYAKAAQNATAAGFDGVEIHGANGYLPDQFLQTTCNQRTDSWGGSIENRARFYLEVVKAVSSTIGAEKTALRLSPYSSYNGMLMDEPEPTFAYLLDQLKPLGLAYVHLIEARIKGNTDDECGGQSSVNWMVKQWDNVSPILLAGGFLPATAQQAVNEKYAEYDVVIVFGRYFVSNPDLVHRIMTNVPLENYDRAVFYTPKEPKGSVSSRRVQTVVADPSL